MYKLYYSPGACSLSVHVALNEIGKPFELINASIPEGKNRDPELLKLNPRGQVPVLLDGDRSFREGAAILLHLLDKEKSALLPQNGEAREKAIEWLMWANASLHPAYSKTFWLKKAVKDEAQQQALLQDAEKSIQSLWDEADKVLSQSKYLAGDTMTIGDIMVTVMAAWSSPNIKFGPNAQRLLDEVRAMPSFQKSVAAERDHSKKAA